jgi:hypothetical protein
MGQQDGNQRKYTCHQAQTFVNCHGALLSQIVPSSLITPEHSGQRTDCDKSTLP